MAAVRRVFDRLWQPGSSSHETSSFGSLVTRDESTGYNTKVDEIRESEYSTLVGTTYLDHAGTTPYAKSAIESWTAELTSNLFGNPHSASASSQLSTRRIEDIRLRVLKFFNADPEDFDLVFVSNATAAIKLVAEAFRDNDDGFWYGYHADAHTSLVGCRELAERGGKCFDTDTSVETWITRLGDQELPQHSLRLLALPGQSNMTGRRLPLRWFTHVRQAATRAQRRVYTLLDAASLVSTSPLDLSDPESAPDFVALSFYKIFGFPDLGALVVRRDSSDVLLQKRYFSGGTVDAVVSSDTLWHARKGILHSALEEGTLPFHNIIALGHAMVIHEQLFGSMKQISEHTRFLARKARNFLRSARHANGVEVCKVYEDGPEKEYGPLVAFNIKNSSGHFLSAAEVEKLCIVKGIQLRVGGLCNPGGIARHLGLSAKQIMSNYQAGRRCGGDNDLMEGMPTGAIRISFGAMSTKSDLQTFTSFIEEYYVEQNVLRRPAMGTLNSSLIAPSFLVESLSIFPIKSCAAFNIPADQRWQVTPKGLAWDREWCLVHEGTNVALSQKRYPQMSQLLPSLDLVQHKMTITHTLNDTMKRIEIDLDDTSSTHDLSSERCLETTFNARHTKVCGDTILLHLYTSKVINEFFSDALKVPCCLARYPRSSRGRNVNLRKPSPDTLPTSPNTAARQTMLANESPMLIVSRSSVNMLNRQILQRAHERGESKPETVSISSFRANIVVTEHEQSQTPSPYVEDEWTSISITQATPTVSLQERPTPGSSHSDSSSINSSMNSNSNSTTPSISISVSIPASSTDTVLTTPSSRTSITSISAPTSAPSLQASAFASSNSKPTPTPAASFDLDLNLDILGPCQRCQMVSINQRTALPQQEPFSTLAKTRRKGDGRVWFGVHAALRCDECVGGGGGGGDEGRREWWVGVGDVVTPRIGMVLM